MSDTTIMGAAEETDLLMRSFECARQESLERLEANPFPSAGPLLESQAQIVTYDDGNGRNLRVRVYTIFGDECIAWLPALLTIWPRQLTLKGQHVSEVQVLLETCEQHQQYGQDIDACQQFQKSFSEETGLLTLRVSPSNCEACNEALKAFMLAAPYPEELRTREWKSKALALEEQIARVAENQTAWDLIDQLATISPWETQTMRLLVGWANALKLLHDKRSVSR